DPGVYIGQVRPYGAGHFGEAGLQSSLTWDTRDHPAAPRKGILLDLGGSAFPPLWSVERTFGEVHGEGRAFASAKIPLRPTIALRAGGKRVFGDHPFHEAAFIGG